MRPWCEMKDVDLCLKREASFRVGLLRVGIY
jgi:hypothetical protein